MWVKQCHFYPEIISHLQHHFDEGRCLSDSPANRPVCVALSDGQRVDDLKRRPWPPWVSGESLTGPGGILWFMIYKTL